MIIVRVTGADYSVTDKSVFTKILFSIDSNCHGAIMARVIIPELILILAVKQAVKLNGLFTLRPIYPPLFNQSDLGSDPSSVCSLASQTSIIKSYQGNQLCRIFSQVMDSLVA